MLSRLLLFPDRMAQAGISVKHAFHLTVNLYLLKAILQGSKPMTINLVARLQIDHPRVAIEVALIHLTAQQMLVLILSMNKGRVGDVGNKAEALGKGDSATQLNIRNLI